MPTRFARCLLFVALVGCGPALPRSDTPVTGIRHELVARTLEWREAATRKDTAALRAIMAPDFTIYRHGNPRAGTLEPWMANLLRSTWDAYEIDDIVVTAYPDVALVRSMQHVRGWRIGDRAAPQRFRVTDLWVKRDGAWRLQMRVSEVVQGPDASR